MTEWPEVVRQGLKSADEVRDLANHWQPAAHPDQFSFMIRSDTGMRDIRMRTTEGRVPRVKQVDMVLGDRPEERGARAHEIPPGAVLDVACRTCGLEAIYEVRNADHWEGACPLHLFSMIAAYLLGSNVVAVSMINKRAKNAERRTAVEQAVQA